MSHRIIISSVSPPAAEADDGIITHIEQEVINVTVEYIPPHSLSESDAGKKVAQLLRQINRMKGEDVTSEDDDA